MTVTSANAPSSAESSVSQTQSSRAHPRTQPDQSHSFAHALREGLDKDKQESQDTPKLKKAFQQPDGKDEAISPSTATGSTAVTKPVTGKFGLPNVPSEATPAIAKSLDAKADAKNLDTDGESSSAHTQVAGLPTSSGSGTPVTKKADAILAQFRFGVLASSHGSKNDPLLACVDLANSPTLAPSLATLAAVQNAPSSPASSATGAGAEKLVQSSNSQSLLDGTAPSNGLTAATATALPGHLAFALRLSAGTLSSQAHTSSSVDMISPAPSVSAASMSSPAQVNSVSFASPDKREEQGSDAPPQHEQGVPDGVVQPSAAQPLQNDTALHTSEAVASTPGTVIDDPADEASTEPVRNVNMQVIGEGNRRVNIALLDRSGELRVSVHSADAELNQRLQDKMPELTSQLEGQKYGTQVWMPRRDNNDGHNQDDSQQQDRPNWVEELQHTSGNPGRNQSTWLQ